MTTGEKIRSLRESRGLLQADLASLIGVSDKAVSTWENGTRLPRMGAVEKLAAYFSLPKSYFYDDEAPKKELPVDETLAIHYKSLCSRPELLELLTTAEAMTKEQVLQLISIARVLQ